MCGRDVLEGGRPPRKVVNVFRIATGGGRRRRGWFRRRKSARITISRGGRFPPPSASAIRGNARLLLEFRRFPVGRFPRKFPDESRISRSWHPSDAGRGLRVFRASERASERAGAVGRGAECVSLRFHARLGNPQSDLLRSNFSESAGSGGSGGEGGGGIRCRMRLAINEY